MPWAEVRDCFSWGPIAPQPPPTPGLSLPDDSQDSDEECLTLNIWTPGLDDGGRPVLVWVHGGGFTTGTGASGIYRGDRLARRGDVVVVTINYRLGALGFLAHRDLSAGSGSGCGNWGLMDQVAALEWVHENVAAFGGDPANVTVFGESAGAMSIGALLATDSCGRLFHKAVLQSGPPATGGVAWAERRAQRFAQLAVGAPFTRETLGSLEPRALVGAAQLLATEVPGEGGLPLPFLPVVDTGLLERPPAEAVSDGASAAVPLLIGTTRDEAALFIATDPAAQELDHARVIRRISRATDRESAQYVTERYRSAREARGEPAEPKDLLTAITTDYVFRMPSLSLACSAYKHQPRTFVYLFAWETPYLGGIFGSSHGLEIPFVFGTAEEPAIGRFTGTGEAAAALSAAMQEAWLAFARGGDPSCEALGEWSGYDPLRRPTMVLGAQRELVEDPREEERMAWDEAGVEFAGGHHHEI